MSKSLQEIIDIAELQELMHFFYEAARIPVGIMNAEQEWLVAIGWQRICTDFHHICPASLERCLQSNVDIQKFLHTGDYQTYKCPLGLEVVAFPILLGDKLIGVFFLGQFLYAAADQDYFRRQALKYGFDIDSYLQALQEVRVISRERIDYLMHFFMRFLGLLMRIGEENRQRQLAEEEIQQAKNLLEVKVHERTQELNQSLLDVGDLAVQLSNALHQVEQLSVTDSLTQSYNRRKFDEIASQEHLRARHDNQTFSVIMLDIDHFKRVNDEFGHSIGDQVLQHLCRVVRGLVRQGDLLIRWGGEEFLVLLPATELAEAGPMAERIRLEIKAEQFSRVGQITVSLGVAQLHEGDSVDSLIQRVDAAMYEAKQKGRDRVVFEALEE